MAWYERDYNRGTTSRGGGRYVSAGGGVGGRFSGAPVSLWLIIINVVIFVIDGIFLGSSRADVIAPRRWMHYSIELGIQNAQVWRFFSYQFVHADFFHVLFNMIGLFFFGPMIERWWGSRRYTAFYLLCGMCGAVLFTLFAFVPGLINVSTAKPIVGASGSIFGVLVACAVLYPHQRVMLMFPPIPMTMRTMALIFLGISALSLIAGSTNAGGDAAHLGGAALGFLFVKQPRLLNFADRLGGMSVQSITLKRLQRKAQKQRQRTAGETAEVDRILDKVRENGMHSLSAVETRKLKRATDRKREAG